MSKITPENRVEPDRRELSAPDSHEEYLSPAETSCCPDRQRRWQFPPLASFPATLLR